MKAAALILALLLVLAHPPVAATVAVAELAACTMLGWLIWRARPFRLYPHWRTT